MLGTVKYQVGMVCNIKEYVEGYQIVNISIGSDNGIYILAVNSVPQRISGMFPQTQISTRQNYKIIIVHQDSIFTVNIDNGIITLYNRLAMIVYYLLVQGHNFIVRTNMI